MKKGIFIIFKIFLFSYLTLGFLGCKEKPKPITVYSPSFNTTSTVEVGQNMFKKDLCNLPLCTKCEN